MANSRMIRAIAALVLFFDFGSTAKDMGFPKYVLQLPYKQRAVPDALNRSTWPWRSWSNGYLVVHRLRSAPDSPGIEIFNPEGALVRSGRVWFPSAATVSVKGVAVDATGRVLASGASLSTSGALADFITSLNGAGQPDITVQTNPFVALKLCAVGDGAVWALGNDRDAERHGGENLILRQFNLTKGQLRSTLDLRQFGAKYLDPESLWLVCNGNTVGVLLESIAQWIQLDLETGRLSFWQLPPIPKQRRITGITLLTNNDLIASVHDYGPPVPRAALFLLSRQARGQATWEGVKGSLKELFTKDESPTELLGNDGDSLVYVGDDHVTVYWSRLDSSSGRY